MPSRQTRQVHPIIELMRKTRIDLGMSLDELGERSGYSGPHICAMEKGRINAKIAMISDVAQALGFKIILAPK